MELLSSYAYVIIVGGESLSTLISYDYKFDLDWWNKKRINEYTTGYMINPGFN